MATTFKRVCIETYTVTDQRGVSFTLYRAKEYLTGPVDADGNVTVFSTYWVKVPVRIFAGEVQFT